MRARLLGWPGQVGIIFERKRFFERTLFEQKFSYIYTAYFSFEFSFEIQFFFERTAFERKPKIRKVWKNGIQKKKMNFERTLFDKTTSSRGNTYLRTRDMFPDPLRPLETPRDPSRPFETSDNLDSFPKSNISTRPLTQTCWECQLNCHESQLRQKMFYLIETFWREEILVLVLTVLQTSL
jgi:hypothetical protein